MLDKTELSSQYYNKACHAANIAHDNISEMEANEGLGDIAYREGNFDDALVHYKLAIKMLALCKQWDNDAFERVTTKLSDSIERKVALKLYQENVANMEFNDKKLSELTVANQGKTSTLDHTYQTIRHYQMAKTLLSGQLGNSDNEANTKIGNLGLTASYLQPREIHHHIARVEQKNLGMSTQYQNLKPEPKNTVEHTNSREKLLTEPRIDDEPRNSLASSKNNQHSRSCIIL